jgi:hemolysin D
MAGFGGFRHKRAMTKAIATLPTRPASVIPVPGSSAARAPRLTATDREFLPAAIEILVTPPSPVARSLLLAICTLFVSALAWSYFGWIDIHAVAQGKIQPSGRSKVVQPLEAGRVVGINVENGSRVNAGDLLLELDRTETSADREAQARDLGAARAEAARRKAAITAALTETFAPQPIKFTDDIEQSIRQREANVMIADLAQLRSSVMSLKAQLAEKLATKERLISTISARQKLIALAQERVSMREQIETRGSGSRALTIEALQQLENYVTTDAGDRGQLLETDAAVYSLTRKMEETVSQFIADQTQKLAEIERKRDRTEQELIKAQSKTDRTQLKSPIDGTVQQLSITTVGQVVTSGQSLLTVVPLEGPIEVEAMIANKDIGFVEPGQPDRQDRGIPIHSLRCRRRNRIQGFPRRGRRAGRDQSERCSHGHKTATGRLDRTTAIAHAKSRLPGDPPAGTALFADRREGGAIDARHGGHSRDQDRIAPCHRLRTVSTARGDRAGWAGKIGSFAASKGGRLKPSRGPKNQGRSDAPVG